MAVPLDPKGWARSPSRPLCQPPPVPAAGYAAGTARRQPCDRLTQGEYDYAQLLSSEPSAVCGFSLALRAGGGAGPQRAGPGGRGAPLGWVSLTCTQDTARSLSHNSAAGMIPGQSTAEADRQTDRWTDRQKRSGLSETALMQRYCSQDPMKASYQGGRHGGET